MRGEEVDIYAREEQKPLSKHCRNQEDIYVSSFEGLSLSQYKNVRSFVCKKEHTQPCSRCEGMIKVADEVITHGFMRLKSAFILSSPSVTHYKASEARRKLLRMPLACLGVGDPKKGLYSLYLVEKQSSVNYQIFQTLLSKAVDNPGARGTNLSKQELKGLVYLAESETEKEMLKYVAVKAGGLSNTKAKDVYGLDNVQKRKEKLEEALSQSKAIRESIEKIACLKDKALLASIGFQVDSDSDLTESESDSESKEELTYEGDDETCGNSLTFPYSVSNSAQHCKTASDGQSEISDHSRTQRPHEFQLGGNSDDCYKHRSETGDVFMNSHQLLDILKSCSFNWFQFVWP